MLAQMLDADAPVEELMRCFAAGLADLAQLLYDKGARVIQIDEPLFTRGTKFRNSTVDALKALVAQLRLHHLSDLWFISVHMCEKHSTETIRMLEKLDVDVLDLELKRFPGNFDVISNDWLKLSQKNIGVGVVDGYRQTVESEGEIRHYVDRILAFYPEYVILKPDCQLRKLPPDFAKGKLKMVSLARQIVLESLS
jgi:methionine synthase II (cobalamin-independent)